MQVRQRLFRGLLFLSCLGLGSASWAGSGQEELSRANELLFRAPHLENVQAPNAVTYRFSRKGPMEKNFSDVVRLEIRGSQEGAGKHVDIQLFSGERRRPFPARENATGNPVLMVFLQRDVLEMEERTDGSWRHFQKYIKKALAESAEVERAHFTHAGERVQGWRIRIRPYLDDPYRDRFPEMAGKSYEILLSSAIPGQIYEMRSVVPGKGEGQEPRLVETLRLQGVQEPGTAH